MALRHQWTIPYPATEIIAQAKALAKPRRENVTNLTVKKIELQTLLNRAKPPINASNLHLATEEQMAMYSEVARIDTVIREDEDFAADLEFFARALAGKNIQLDLHLDDVRFFGLA